MGAAVDVDIDDVAVAVAVAIAVAVQGWVVEKSTERDRQVEETEDGIANKMSRSSFDQENVQTKTRNCNLGWGV